MGLWDKLQKIIVIVDDEKKEETRNIEKEAIQREKTLSKEKSLSLPKTTEETTTGIENITPQKTEAPKQKIRCSKKFSEELDEEQRKAVEAPLVNTCVIAVAGSGKTRVLTYRVANMIDNDYPEQEMILLTFTKKASQEMTDRIKKILVKSSLNLLSGTFHGIGNQLLHEYAGEIGLPYDFKVLNPESMRSIIRELRWEFLKNHYWQDVEEADRKFPATNIIMDIYSGAINHNLSFMDFIRKYYYYYENQDLANSIILIIEDYVRYKQEKHMLDFDDLILKMLDMLCIDEIREKINERYKYVFVDEHQDINWIQYGILEKLNANNSMFVIGDPKQCIYQFRGSKPEYITKFKKEHLHAQQYSISHNYRSTPEIMSIASDIINYGEPSDRQMQIKAANEKGMQPILYGAMSEEFEIKWIADIIKKENLDVKKTAILVRKGNQITFVKQILKMEGIKCKADKEVPLTRKEHIKIVMNALEAVFPNCSEESFASTGKIFGISKNRGLMLYENVVQKGRESIGNLKFTKKEQDFLSCMDMLADNCYNSSIKVLIEKIMENFLDDYFKMRFFNYEEVMDDILFIEKMAGTIKEFDIFKNSLTLLDEEGGEGNGKTITITTVHKSKGLEYENVFLPFVTKGAWPRGSDSNYINQTDSVKNERNLFYVGVTRAMKKLYISYSLTSENEGIAGKSPFLTEVKQEHLKEINGEAEE